MSDADIVRRELERQNYALGNDDEPTDEALAALTRMEEEVKQSFYYRECRDTWRKQAESAVEERDRLKDQLAEAEKSRDNWVEEADAANRYAAEQVANGLRLAEELTHAENKWAEYWDRAKLAGAEVERLRAALRVIRFIISEGTPGGVSPEDDVNAIESAARQALEGSTSEGGKGK